MERKTLIPIVLSIIFVGLIPMVARGQGDSEASTRRLKIAVPVREFEEFVKIQYNPETGKNNYSGFAIEVFYEVQKTLLSPFLFDFVPFEKPDGTMNGYFDKMLEAVFN